MRTTVTIDDELYVKALQVAAPGMDKADPLANRSHPI
jgi:Arc/MetJ family transcription regulator